MVLESIMSVKDAIERPWYMFIFGLAVSFGSLGVAYLVFPQSAGLLTVFLITLVTAPFMLKLFRYQEWSEENQIRDLSFFERINPLGVFFRQRQTFVLYCAFIAGVVVAMTTSYIVLPESFVEKAFNDQLEQIGKINAILGNATSDGTFMKILSNNLIVMSVSFIFALLLGIGAIFELSWNASVLAAAIGLTTKATGLTGALAAFLPHGIFEIAAYFIAGIAGGVISATVSRRGIGKMTPVILDMLAMMVIAAVLVVVAAFIESPPV